MGGAPPPAEAQADWPTPRSAANVQAARHYQPRSADVSPPLARQTRISGTVRLHAIIGKDGTIQQLEVMSGHPLLQQAALGRCASVALSADSSQWRSRRSGTPPLT